MRPLKIRNAMAGHRKLTTTNWEQSSKLILLKLHQKLPKNSTPTILWPFSIWSKLERWKSSISECPMSWSKTKKKKNHRSEVSSSLILYNNHPHLLLGLWHGTKSGFYMTTRDDQLSGWTKKKLQTTSQSQTCTKKNGHGHCLVICYLIWSTTVSWILAKLLHLRSMLSKTMRYTENCNACSQHWSTEWTQSSVKCPTAHHSTNTSKFEWIGLRSFASYIVFTWPLSNWQSLLQVSR